MQTKVQKYGFEALGGGSPVVRLLSSELWRKGSRNTNCVRKYQMTEGVRIECRFSTGTEPIS